MAALAAPHYAVELAAMEAAEEAGGGAGARAGGERMDKCDLRIARENFQLFTIANPLPNFGKFRLPTRTFFFLLSA